MTEVMEKPVNIEGDYDEIVKWMDEHPMMPVMNVMSHGIRVTNDEGTYGPLNFGLFSVCADPGHETYTGGAHKCEFNVWGWEFKSYYVTEEDLVDSHLLVF